MIRSLTIVALLGVCSGELDIEQIIAAPWLSNSAEGQEVLLQYTKTHLPFRLFGPASYWNDFHTFFSEHWKYLTLNEYRLALIVTLNNDPSKNKILKELHQTVHTISQLIKSETNPKEYDLPLDASVLAHIGPAHALSADNNILRTLDVSSCTYGKKLRPLLGCLDTSKLPRPEHRRRPTLFSPSFLFTTYYRLNSSQWNISEDSDKDISGDDNSQSHFSSLSEPLKDHNSDSNPLNQSQQTSTTPLSFSKPQNPTKSLFGDDLDLLNNPPDITKNLSHIKKPPSKYLPIFKPLRSKPSYVTPSETLSDPSLSSNGPKIPSTKPAPPSVTFTSQNGSLTAIGDFFAKVMGRPTDAVKELLQIVFGDPKDEEVKEVLTVTSLGEMKKKDLFLDGAFHIRDYVAKVAILSLQQDSIVKYLMKLLYQTQDVKRGLSMLTLNTAIALSYLALGEVELFLKALQRTEYFAALALYDHNEVEKYSDAVKGTDNIYRYIADKVDPSMIKLLEKIYEDGAWRVHRDTGLIFSYNLPSHLELSCGVLSALDLTCVKFVDSLVLEQFGSELNQASLSPLTRQLGLLRVTGQQNLPEELSYLESSSDEWRRMQVAGNRKEILTRAQRLTKEYESLKEEYKGFDYLEEPTELEDLEVSEKKHKKKQTATAKKKEAGMKRALGKEIKEKKRVHDLMKQAAAPVSLVFQMKGLLEFVDQSKQTKVGSLLNEEKLIADTREIYPTLSDEIHVGLLKGNIFQKRSLMAKDFVTYNTRLEQLLQRYTNRPPCCHITEAYRNTACKECQENRDPKRSCDTCRYKEKVPTAKEWKALDISCSSCTNEEDPTNLLKDAILEVIRSFTSYDNSNNTQEEKLILSSHHFSNIILDTLNIQNLLFTYPSVTRPPKTQKNNSMYRSLYSFYHSELRNVSDVLKKHNGVDSRPNMINEAIVQYYKELQPHDNTSIEGLINHAASKMNTVSVRGRLLYDLTRYIATATYGHFDATIGFLLFTRFVHMAYDDASELVNEPSSNDPWQPIFRQIFTIAVNTRAYQLDSFEWRRPYTIPPVIPYSKIVPLSIFYNSSLEWREYLLPVKYSTSLGGFLNILLVLAVTSHHTDAIQLSLPFSSRHSALLRRQDSILLPVGSFPIWEEGEAFERHGWQWEALSKKKRETGEGEHFDAIREEDIRQKKLIKQRMRNRENLIEEERPLHDMLARLQSKQDLFDHAVELLGILAESTLDVTVSYFYTLFVHSDLALRSRFLEFDSQLAISGFSSVPPADDEDVKPRIVSGSLYQRLMWLYSQPEYEEYVSVSNRRTKGEVVEKAVMYGTTQRLSEAVFRGIVFPMVKLAEFHSHVRTTHSRTMIKADLAKGG